VATGRLNEAIALLEAGEAGEAGEVVVSSRPLPSSDADAQAYGNSDFDMVVFEMEHVGFDFTALRRSLQALLHRGRVVADGLRHGAGPSPLRPVV
jgi:hypothetical protein